MYKIKIPATIHNIFAIFYLIGMWNEKTSFKDKGRKLFYLVYFVSFFLSLSVGAFVNSNTDEFMFLAVVSIIIAVQICRMSCVIRNKNEILELIYEVNNSSAFDLKEFVRVDRKIKLLIKFGKFFIIMMSFSFSFLMISPVALNENILVFKIAFPLDWRNDRIAFWMAYAYVGGGFFLSAICCLFSITVWYLMLIFTIRYEMLGNQFRNMGVMRTDERSVEKPKNSEIRSLFYLDLLAAIKAFEKINEY